MSGIQHYITDLNTRFTNLLFASKTGDVYDYKRKFWGLARVDIDGVPFINESGEYKDVLFNDKYDISSFFVLAGDDKIRPYSTDSKIDLIVMANMKSFSAYTEEDIFEMVYQIMKVTPFGTGFDTYARDVNALKEFKYQDKIKETLHPYFVFRIKCRLLGILKQL